MDVRVAEATQEMQGQIAILSDELVKRTVEMDSLKVKLEGEIKLQSDAIAREQHVAATATKKLFDRTHERDKIANERNEVVADRARIMAAMIALTSERDRLEEELSQWRREREAIVAEREAMQSQVPTEENSEDNCPFRRYRPHCFVRGVVPAGSASGQYDVAPNSPLFVHLRQLCDTGGSWTHFQRPVAGFRLARVQAVVAPTFLVTGFTMQQERMNSQRATGGVHFNFKTAQSFDAEQLRVLNTLRDAFQERAPGSGDRTVNTVHCFHGSRREHVESICNNGLVAVGGTDAGFFGMGCYTTLNIEYAARYAYGDFDEDEQGRRTGPRSSPDRMYPVIMMAATVGMAYPITREADYEEWEQHSKFFGKPLKRGFDAHVACVSELVAYQATKREQCQYVELVIEQQAQLLPMAVLWLEKI